MIARGLAVVAIAGALAAAAAASPRLPPPIATRLDRSIADPDADAETESRFWTGVVDPGAAGRRAAVADAIRALRLTAPNLTAVEASLVAATEAAPDEPDAWGYLAIVAERRRSWSSCARAVRRVTALAPSWVPDPSIATGRTRSAPPRSPALVEAGCWLRAGALTEAAAVIERAVDRGAATPELWLLAGQVALARGHLTDAIDALGRARGPMAAWLTALALERAGRESALAALAVDLDDRRPPWIGEPAPMIDPADADHAIAVAAWHNGRVDRALIFFRRFLAQAPADSPWRTRATARAEALANAPWPAPAIRGSDGDGKRRDGARAALTAAVPAMSACLSKVPTGLVDVAITAVGPPLPVPRRPPPVLRSTRPSGKASAGGGQFIMRTRASFADPGQAVSYAIAPLDEVSGDVRAQALSCVERVAATVTLPKPAAGDYLTVSTTVRAR